MAKKSRKLELNESIGTAKDNMRSPVHDWYKFTAGFSYKLVDEIILLESLKKGDRIYEPFAGCGTTLVTAQKRGIEAIGNEGQKLLLDVINAKLNWNVNETSIQYHLGEINKYIGRRKKKVITGENPLLYELYSESNLRNLVLIREYLSEADDLSRKVKTFLKLALSQTLHKCSKHPISIPYIVWSKTLSNTISAKELFETQVHKMLLDLQDFRGKHKTCTAYLHDSRKINRSIGDKTCHICITSPPYLNNLDYGEISKVPSHFFGITSTWGDITSKVRKNLVTGATTHYKISDFDLDKFKQTEFFIKNRNVASNLLKISSQIKSISKGRGGKKSFDLLTIFYFTDMYDVLKEMSRILKTKGKAYLILGDSAPYGVYINTTKILGQISKSVGFNKYSIKQIRRRGSKWQGLKYRHSEMLSENLLILEK